MMKRASQVVMVGTFPPPMHGMAAVNASVGERLLEAGARVMVLNTAPSSLNRGMMARLGRWPRVLRGLARLAGSRHLRGGVLYIGVAGGVGQVYDLAFLLLARARRMRVFAHHHSFAYLDKRSRLTGWLLRLAGARSVHVVLSQDMASRLQAQYNVERTVPVSNAVFFLTPSLTHEGVAAPRRQLHTLGLLSNLSAEKGVFMFLDLMTTVRDAGLQLHGKLAGPFQDAEIERQVRARLAHLPQVEYVGPKYGAEKDVFFASIDAFVLPTTYVNEAEPLVLHEVMQRGIPVIAYGRGSIPEVVGAQGGLVVSPAAPFVPAALDRLQAWINDPASFEAAARAAARRFAETYSDSERRWQALLGELVGGIAKSQSHDERMGSMSSKN